jgi:hypothetical protein
MAFNHKYTATVSTPTETWSDGSTSDTTGDTVTEVATTVDANGGSANAVAIAFTAAGFQSLFLQATVPCVVTLTGATVIDGVSTSDVTLTANVIRRVSSITGNVTAVSVGANTTTDGAAGTIKISALFNS